MKRLSSALAVLLLAGAAPLGAQLAPPTSGGIVSLDNLLQRLGENRRVLIIGAHPDDEDTSLLALMVQGFGADAAYLSLSRGEGGQNLIGRELGGSLGLLRSSELVAARGVDGARQFFTRSFDFGYSRELSETSRFWPPDSTLKDVVRIVRRFRPHVIVSVFSGTPRDGHGQHQAAGLAARQAFEAAGDPNRFPELASEEALTFWRPLKLYQSTRFDRRSTTLELSTGQLDPRSGKTFHQIAMASRSSHSSQDMGRIQSSGPASTRLRLIETRAAGQGNGGSEHSIFDGIPRDTSWLVRLADSVRASVSANRIADATVPLAWSLGRADFDLFSDGREKLLEQAIEVSAGLVMDARSSSVALVPGRSVEVVVELFNGGPYNVVIDSFFVDMPSDWTTAPLDPPSHDLAPGEQATAKFSVAVPADAELTQPYFLKRPRQGALYDWTAAQPELRGLPFDPPVLMTVANVRLLGESITVQREVTYRHNDQATGEIRDPVRVVPGIDVKLSPKRLVWPSGGTRWKTLTVTLTHNGADTVSGTVVLEAVAWRMPSEVPFTFERFGESKVFNFRISKPLGVESAALEIAAIATTDDGRRFSQGIELVDYPHIRSASSVGQATADVLVAPIKLPTVNSIGYVRGAADRVPEALQQVGLPIEILDADALASSDLSVFDVIVIGSRAYESDPAVVKYNDRLLEYARGGGLLLVQYQQYQFARGDFAPYPITISRPHDRITDETAPVTVLLPDDPIFTSPNTIGPEDWEGWPQERGLYFAGEWDDAYTPALEMKDPNREPVRGGLLVAKYGAGTYVYTGISFFRSLPAGVPGAYKLFLNLLNLSQRPVQ